MPPPTTAVTRHLNFAWIEFGHTADAQAFAAGIAALGWKNLLLQLPRKKDDWGSRYVDSANPNLPVRWKGSGLLALPNSYVDSKTRPMVSDPIFKKFMESHTEDEFREELRKICGFLSQWVWSPGVKKSSATDASLTVDPDATEWADLVAASGHGAAGTVWGGDSNLGLELAQTLENLGAPAHSDRLKYVIIPTCYNLSSWNVLRWNPALRRPKPIHGILGYSDSYPGGDPGGVFFGKFTALLKADSGKKPILEAWKQAHAGSYSDRWGAVMHVESKADTMKDWLAGKLAEPDPAGEIRHFTEASWPDGEVVADTPKPYSAYFFMGATKIDGSNNNLPDVGLFSGESGALEIAKTSGTFAAGKEIVVVFFYYRPTKDGMDVSKLLDVVTVADATVTLEKDFNAEDATTEFDAIRVKATKAGISTIRIPFTVRSDAHAHYHADGARSYGYFWMKVVPFDEDDSPFYPDGAWLRGPR
ncbi:MAG: hypothetical protein HYY17_02780 [Planctomycetes bacterium]|nr:hypothetical protein [Planctomycetota bacterium]